MDEFFNELDNPLHSKTSSPEGDRASACSRVSCVLGSTDRSRRSDGLEPYTSSAQRLASTRENARTPLSQAPSKRSELTGCLTCPTSLAGRALMPPRKPGYDAMRGNERCHDEVTSCIGRFSGGK
jgi:hypothetical protein